MYDKLIKRLRVSCESCKLWDGYKCCLNGECSAQKSLQAADTIEELQEDLERSKDFEAFWQHAAEEALKKFQVAISNKPHWIPMTERLPEENGKYLTVFTVNTIPPRPVIEVSCYAKDLYKIDKYDFHDKKRKHGFYQYDSEWGFFEKPDVSHWMPLPQPPKREGE